MWHSSMAVAPGLLLVGGYDSPGSTSLLLPGHSTAQEGPQLAPGRRLHCSVQTSPSSVILTGGSGSESLVTSHSSLTPEGPMVVEELPPLLLPRDNHACAGYWWMGVQTVLVSGGYHAGDKLASTELLHLDSPTSSQGAWREVGPLPSPRYYPRATGLSGVVYLTGGGGDGRDLDEVLAFHPETEAWVEAGRPPRSAQESPCHDRGSSGFPPALLCF